MQYQTHPMDEGAPFVAKGRSWNPPLRICDLLGANQAPAQLYLSERRKQGTSANKEVSNSGKIKCHLSTHYVTNWKRGDGKWKVTVPKKIGDK